jgi:hypothetical protein
VGKINGTINGQKIDGELQGYVYIEDGRVHNSLYNMPLTHSNLQQLTPLFNTISWLFGTIHRFSDPIENGFALTGLDSFFFSSFINNIISHRWCS